MWLRCDDRELEGRWGRYGGVGKVQHSLLWERSDPLSMSLVVSLSCVLACQSPVIGAFCFSRVDLSPLPSLYPLPLYLSLFSLCSRLSIFLSLSPPLHMWSETGKGTTKQNFRVGVGVCVGAVGVTSVMTLL